MRRDITKVSAGVLGPSQAVSTNICQIANPGAGRYEIWGTVRHTKEDGCKLIVGASLVLFRIPQGANQASDFGPFIIDINNNTDDIVLQIDIATDVADSASGALYAVRINS